MKFHLDYLSKNFILSSPATGEDIARLDSFFKYPFPLDYRKFLSVTNGLEGKINSEYLVVWSAKEMIELNSAYYVKEFVANVIIFGSDGAEDAFGFDISNPVATIVKLPFIGMGYMPSKKIADSFDEFLRLKIPNDFFAG